DDAVLTKLREHGERVEALHQALLPAERVDARIEPYRSAVAVGGSFEVEVHVSRGPARVELVVPNGWGVEAVGGTRFRVTAAGVPVVRARIAADVSVAGARYGQLAEALVDVA